MKQTVIHYNNALDPATRAVALCRPTIRCPRVTAIPTRVTCKSCLKIMGRRS